MKLKSNPKGLTASELMRCLQRVSSDTKVEMPDGQPIVAAHLIDGAVILSDQETEDRRGE